MKDIKGLLKEARDAIKNKDYQTSLKISKCILKEDKSNYMAMVFLGLSLQEVGPKDHTSKAFQKAIGINPQNPLAYQGLINYYEKLNGDEVKSELIKTIISYLEIELIEKKLVEYCTKLFNISEYGDKSEISKVFYNTSRKCTGEAQLEILILLSQFMEKYSDIEGITKLYEDCITDLKSSVPENFYLNYLTCLYKNGEHLKVLDRSIEMLEMFPYNTTALSWICKIYNQLYVEEFSGIDTYRDKVGKYVDALLSLDSKNAMGIFSKAVLSVQDNNLMDSREMLTEVTSLRPGLIYAWVLSTDVLLKLYLVEEASVTFFESKKLIQTMSNPGLIASKIVYQELEIISRSNNTDNLRNAISIYTEKDFDYTKCLPAIIRININLEQYVEAYKYISELNKINKEQAKMYEIYLLRKQRNYQQAIKIIDGSSLNFSEWWIEVGSLFWETGDYNKCLDPFLKAAKCNPNNHIAFINLGNYYNKFGQLDKSRRCFEKAIKINPKSSEAGSELSKIYRKQKKWDENLNLLTCLTEDTISKENLWAWLQLGLTYLEQRDGIKALDYLRMVLRIDPDNMHCWESLADAYFSKGSYTSALKCYQKAFDLSQGSLYSTLQVANINKILGEYTEAREGFESILITNEKYVPALKGLCETCLSQAKECYKEQRLGTARDHAQIACNKVSLAVQQRSELSCLWKLLADCIFFVAKLPEANSYLKISSLFLDGKKTEEYEIIDQPELYSLAAKCYCKAVSLATDNPFLWHDLGTCYLEHACLVKQSTKKLELLKFAMAAVQQCTTMNPGNWQHWNLMGNVAMFSDPPNYALAQHSFIKAVIAEHNSAVAWTNLGILYLVLDDLKLANKAFGEGQRSDPNYVNSWIGQAIIAENMAHSDAMDLFRHSTQLGQHQEGSIGYGHWVCHVLLNSLSNDKATQYSIYNMHAIPVACDSVNWYTEKNPFDGCGWNMLGILYERMGLIRSARKAFKRAYALANKQYKDTTRINYGRLLYRTGNYSEAIKMFQEVQEATFSSVAGLALALFRDGQYEESFTVYEQALYWLSVDPTYQSDLLVALASMAYKFQGVDAAKTLLFQSIELKPPSSWSLYSTFSLAMIHKDFKLAKLVLTELTNLEVTFQNRGKEHSEYIHHYCTLLSYYYTLNNDSKGAISELSKLVHKYPHEASTWLTLSQLLFRLQKNKKKLVAGATCADVAIRLDRRSTNNSKVLCLAALSFFMIEDFKRASLYAQKAIHYCPNSVEGWITLLALKTESGKKILPTNIVRNLPNYFRQIDCNQNIISWTEGQISGLTMDK